MQRALMQYKDPKNYRLVLEALTLAGRTDLIGYGPACLIRPPRGESAKKAPAAKPAAASRKPAPGRKSAPARRGRR